MAFFKFRQRGQAQPEPRRRADAAAAASPQETVDGLRRRARHRLVGAIVLVILAVIGFPLLFDTQPRPVAVDAPITIPDKDKTPPLRAPGSAQANGARVPDNASLGDKEEVVIAPPAASRSPAASAVTPARVAEGSASAASRAAEAPRAETKPEAKPDARAAEDAARARREEEAKARRDEAEARAKRDEDTKARRDEADARAQREAEAKAKRDEEAKARREEADAKAKAKREEAARARAILEGRAKAPAAEAASEQGRFIIQVGAFADDSAARDVRQKAERVGVKTYTQTIDTKDGKRTRVRVGPFSSRADAEKAAAALKKAGLGGSILSL